MHHGPGIAARASDPGEGRIRCERTRGWSSGTPAARQPSGRVGRERSCLAGDRRYVARSWTHTVQPPAGVLPGRALDAQDLRRLPGREGYVEAIERHREPVAERLDDGFLAGPAVEESQRSVARLEAVIRHVLDAREIASGDVVGVADFPDGFDIDADRVSA